MPYRIAFAVARYFEFGGMQRTYLRMARECAKRGHEVHAIVGDWEGERPPGISITELRVSALTNHGANAAFGRALRGVVSKIGFDCVVGFTKIPGLDVYYGGDPCYVERCRVREKGRLHRLSPRYRAFRDQEAAVFGQGEDVEIMLIAHREAAAFMEHHGTEPDRIHLLPPGIDRDRVRRQLDEDRGREALCAELGMNPEDEFVLVVGSGFRTKGVDRLIRGFAALPEDLRSATRLVVVGKGDARAYAALAAADGVGDRVDFTGPRSDVARFYRHAALLAHPARVENTGTTLIEAMICGLPVVVTGNCGFAHYVEQADAGIVVDDPFEPKRFAAALREGLTSARRTEWSENGPGFCEANDLYSLIEKGVDVIVDRAARDQREAAR